MRNLLILTLGLATLLELAEAGQGCPFDDGSCQEYCNQQGCNMGYCGHFAWIQCICRKCGDEWSWYDKVRYNPDKMVNQTELDSLKLNNTNALILTNSPANQQQQQQQQVPISSNATVNNQTNQTTTDLPANQVAKQQKATLTTLLIPDLSDNGRLDLNDIPDENSDKFLDYLDKNHEKLVQASSICDPSKMNCQQAKSKLDGEATDEEIDDEQASGSTLPSTSAEERADDDTIEIQISTNNNNNNKTEPKPEPAPAAAARQEGKSPITRLLKLAVMAETD